MKLEKIIHQILESSILPLNVTVQEIIDVIKQKSIEKEVKSPVVLNLYLKFVFKIIMKICRLILYINMLFL